MKYAEIIDKEKKQQNAATYNQENSKFEVASGTFAVFTNTKWGDAEKEAANQNWKAHISIATPDLAKAWDLIYPLLAQHADQFKIIDANRLKEAGELHRTELEKARGTLSEFVRKYMSNELDNSELLTLAKRCSYERSEWEKLINNREGLFNFINQRYSEAVAKAEQTIEEDKRMAEGMQITVYIQPGREKEHQQLLEKIEELLLKNDIKPGIIYKTDRALGHFSSIRHPGKEYHDAVQVQTYNPDNAPDDFKHLKAPKIADFEAQLRDKISILRGFEITNTMNDTEKHNVRVKHTLAGHLEKKLNVFSKKDIQTKIKHLNNFNNNCIEEVKTADQALKNDQEWKPLLKNLALLFSGIGTLAVVVSIGFKLSTGRYGAFDNKEKLFDTQSRFKKEIQEGACAEKSADVTEELKSDKHSPSIEP